MGVHRTLELTSLFSNQWGQWNKSCYPHFTDEETETLKDWVKKKSSNIGNGRSISWSNTYFSIKHFTTTSFSFLQSYSDFLLIWKENWEGKEPVVKENGGGANWEQSGTWWFRTWPPVWFIWCRNWLCGRDLEKTQSDSAQWAVFCVLCIPRDFCDTSFLRSATYIHSRAYSLHKYWECQASDFYVP